MPCPGHPSVSHARDGWGRGYVLRARSLLRGCSGDVMGSVCLPCPARGDPGCPHTPSTQLLVGSHSLCSPGGRLGELGTRQRRTEAAVGPVGPPGRSCLLGLTSCSWSCSLCPVAPPRRPSLGVGCPVLSRKEDGVRVEGPGSVSRSKHVVLAPMLTGALCQELAFVPTPSTLLGPPAKSNKPGPAGLAGRWPGDLRGQFQGGGGGSGGNQAAVGGGFGR